MNYQLIKILCKRRGLTESKLIQLIDVSTPGYYLMVRKKNIRVDLLEKISEALKVNPCLFFKEELQTNDEQLLNNSLALEPEVNYSAKSMHSKTPPESVELIELMRFKINTLEKELLELKGNSKPEQ